MIFSLTACSSSGKKASDTAATEETGTISNDTDVAPTETAVAKTYTAGACFYSFSDTYTANVRQSLENISNVDGKITISSADDQGDSSIQTNNMNNFLTQGVDYLALTNIMPNSTSDICKQVSEAGKTLILFGCDSPSEDDFNNYPTTWFVGSKASESDSIMGDAVAKYWKEHPTADRNGNGKLDYIMLLGVQGSYDSEQRSTYAVKAVEDAGIQINNLSGDLVCYYSRATAQEKVAALLLIMEMTWIVYFL